MTKSFFDMYSHILTSVIGSHPNNQDALRYYESDDKIIAVVADGLGSCRKSADGARLICKICENELKGKNVPLKPSDINCSDIWYQTLQKNQHNKGDFCTTCSFAFIDKVNKQVCIGQIGDSPIFIKLDDSSVIEIRQEKDFLNITDCLGSTENTMFSIHTYTYQYKVNVMVSTDGIGDELESSYLDSLFKYLRSKYDKFTIKSRSRRFTKEIKSTIGKINHDDKSAIFIWK